MQIVRDCETLDIGGKAANLCRLREFCNVPPFFAVCFDSPEEIDNPTKQREIINECERRGFDVMAVRSSASCEDSEEASFAGMFKSIVGVTRDHTIEAISQVVSSATSERVSSYCEAKALSAEALHMNVIVQEFIDARVAGVCFTRADSDQQMIIEACFGLGTAVVSGAVTPDIYRIGTHELNVMEKQVHYQSWAYRFSQETSQIEKATLPFHSRAAGKLSDADIEEIASQCIEIEKMLSMDAADIEWAYGPNTLHILQARPLRSYRSSPGTWRR